MDTNCFPLVVDLFLFCYERYFMLYLSGDKDAESIDAVNSTSIVLDDLFHIDNTYFDGKIKHIDPSEHQCDKANSTDTNVSFLDLHLTISDGCVSQIYDFDFDIVNILI